MLDDLTIEREPELRRDMERVGDHRVGVVPKPSPFANCCAGRLVISLLKLNRQ